MFVKLAVDIYTTFTLFNRGLLAKNYFQNYRIKMLRIYQKVVHNFTSQNLRDSKKKQHNRLATQIILSG